MKRILIVSIIIIVCLGAGYYFLFEKKIQFSSDTSVFRAVPIDAPMFVEFTSVKDFPKDNEALNGIFHAGFLNSLSDLITKLDSLIENTENINHSLINDPFVIVLNLEGREEISPVIIVKAESAKKKRELEKLTSLLYPENIYDYNSRQYNGEKITDVGHSFGQSFSFSFTNGLLIGGSKSIMVEKAVRQLTTESLVDNTIFRKVQKTATQQAEASVYINHQFFPELLSLFVNGTTEKKVNEFGEEVRVNHENSVVSFSGFSSWSELDLSAKPNELRLNGISLAPDSLFQYLTVFQKQDPVKIKIDEVMPRNTALFYSIGFSKKKEFFENLEEYFTHSTKYYKREEKIKLIESAARADLKPVFENNVEDEAAIVFSDILSEPRQRNVYFIVSVEAGSKAREEILGWLQKYSTRKNIDFSSLKSEYKIDTETSFSFYKFPYPSFPGIWLGEPFSAVQANYLAFRGNYMIFAETRSSLENLLHELLLGSTLAKDQNYLKTKDKTENRANINFYLDVNAGYNLNSEFLNKELAKQIKDKEEVLRKFSAFSWQVLNTEDILFNNILFDYSEKVDEDAKTTWQSNIGSAITMKPLMVTNHNDPVNKEIIVQDDKNRLHLITQEGRVRWSVEIPGKILGTIFQVDYLRNGKLQFLFNTKDKIYLIDREGNNVLPFPVALRSPATNGLNVFDYDNNRKYRYFVAGE
ncbi:MAG: hypothetical protein JXR31_03805, partial [Prolixibacteraceae bacterium]|nr:hypothetical protein [Prolixibacteraceae bacterium]